MASADASESGEADHRSAPAGSAAPDLRAVLALALVEARRYGDDDSVWIREVVQNARDAAATRITFQIVDDGVLIEDDGSGMSRGIITGQLLRLFSSSKMRDDDAAGCFGVGFWSVLRASPDRIEVDTDDGHEQIGLTIHLARGDITERDGRRRARGTSIRLVGTRINDATLRQAMAHHAGMVMGRSDARDGQPPALILVTRHGDERLNRPFSIDDVPGLVARAPVEGRGFRGFVGLSASPRVELFHHGLRVVEATSLSSIVPSLRQRPRRGLGLVVRVDVPGVKVLVDRQTVVEDDVVRALVAACDDAATRLERQVLDDAAPLPVLRRGIDAVARLLDSTAVNVAVKAVAVGVTAAAAGLGLGMLALGDARPDWTRSLPWATTEVPVHVLPRTISDVVDQLAGPRVDTLGQTPAGFALATRHIVDDLLAIDVREIPDNATGLRARDLHPRLVGIAPTSTTATGIVATARLRGRGLTVVPSSLVVWPARAYIDGLEVPIGISADGLPLVEVPDGRHDDDAGRVVDVFYGLAGRRPPAEVPVVRHDALVPLVDAGGGRLDIEGVRRIGVAVATAIRYGASADDARRFDADGRPLIERALGLGVGDCDVINTVFVRALQQAGFNARLVRGFVVRHDAVATELHAWGEVFADDAWHMVDASPPSAVPVPSTAPGIAAPGSPAPVGLAVAAGSQAVPVAPGTSPGVGSSPEGPGAAATPGLPQPQAIDADRGTWRDPVVAGAALVGLLAASGLLYVVRRPRRRDDAALDDVTELLVAALHGGAADHLGLLERPIVPTSHGLISLSRARTLASTGRLAISRDGRPPSTIDPGVHVLDRRARRVVALGPWLPHVVDLDVIGKLLAIDSRDDERLAPLQRRVDGAFSTVVLRPMPGPGLSEVHLRTIDRRTHQIFVGPDVFVGPDLRALPPEQLWRRLLDEATSLWRLRERP